MQMLISSVDTTEKTSVLIVIHTTTIIVWTVSFDYFLIYHGYLITEYNFYCNQLGVYSNLSHAVMVEGHDVRRSLIRQ